MNREGLEKILRSLAEGTVDVEEAMRRLRHFPYEDLAFARLEHHRSLRQGVPEVVLARGKRAEDTVAIARAMYRESGRLLVTKAPPEVFEKLGMEEAAYHRASGLIMAGEAAAKTGSVLVVSAGTSDIPVAEEAALTASFLGSRTKTLYDVGVSGIHRLMEKRGALEEARVLVVVAGMEGALPSVVGGLTSRPVVAVPTSVGYGASLGGLTALFAMLNSCVPGIAVMNIDNGFGAGCLAHRINTLEPPAAETP
ncbi:MAG: nickel pincer cofactor biosynthesis protein LarB [Nitrospirota bacterium]|jgi:NCAIR mutase (PurE)-related protein